MNIHVRRQVPLRLFQLTEPAGLVPSWLTTQGTQQHVWPSSKGTPAWPSCSPSVTRLACTSRAQSKSRPSGWGGDTKANPTLGESNQAY